MGIKGTVCQSRDGDFIHSNIDTNLIISEKNVHGLTEKPAEEGIIIVCMNKFLIFMTLFFFVLRFVWL